MSLATSPLNTSTRAGMTLWSRPGLVTFWLLAPLVLYLIAAFILPILHILFRSVENSEVASALPRTIAAMHDWNGSALPPDSAFEALSEDLRDPSRVEAIQLAARRLNYEVTGFRSLLTVSARKVKAEPTGGGRAQLLQIDPRWGERDVWAAIKRNAKHWTDFYILKALDLRRDVDGRIADVPADQSVYRLALGRTFWIGLLVTGICLILSYPLAYLISASTPPVATFLITLVLIPLWTSVLVRTTAWIVLLQSHGPVVESLLWLGLIDERITLVFNRTGVLIAMVHVLLPYCVLSIYSNMKAIDPRYFRAALSLGAPPLTAFLTVYLPQTLPGIGAGCVLTFTLAIGYYITPELVGGGGDQMISHYIARDTIEFANWGQASALCLILLLSVATVYAIYSRWFGLKQLSLNP